MPLEPKEYFERRALERLDGENPTIKDLAEGLKMLYGRLWSKEELVALITATHNGLCMECPRAAAVGRAVAASRTQGQRPDGLSPKLVAIITSLIGLLGTVIGYICK